MPSPVQPASTIDIRDVTRRFGQREVLRGGGGWGEVGPAVALLVPLSVLSMAIGVAAFRLALRRERRLGTLVLY